jgi:hypothetical protein
MQRQHHFQMQPFDRLFQCQVGLVFNLKIVYGEPSPDLLPHHFVPNML